MEEVNHAPEVTLLGDTNVGKTCIIWRAVRNEFNEYYSTCSPNEVFLNKTVFGSTINLKLIDTPGQIQYSSLNKTFYRNSKAIIIVFDINDKKTFDHVDKIFEDVKNTVDVDKVKIYLVGNKYDLYNDINNLNKVPLELAHQKANLINAEFSVTSAKNGDYINDLFVNIAGNLEMSEDYIVNDTCVNESAIDIAKESESNTKSKCC